jgi:hypothetical protein
MKACVLWSLAACVSLILAAAAYANTLRPQDAEPFDSLTRRVLTEQGDLLEIQRSLIRSA